MTAPVKRAWVARIRGANLFGRQGVKYMQALRQGQPLMLIREPNNAVDKNAIRLTDLYGQNIGYVERGIAAKIALLLDTGVILMAMVSSRKLGRIHARARIWIDAGEADIQGRRSTAIPIGRIHAKARS